MKALRIPATDPVFGRYEPIALLGEGSVARVYLALSRGPIGGGDPVVIKEIRPELASQPLFREMFLHEARMALRLHHPNIVRTYEIFEERAPYVVAMEFLDGQPLAEVLRRLGRAEVSLALHLWMLTQVLAGLHHAYEVRDAEGKPLQIVHRDVNPGNVFVTYDGQVKLVDFGIAKFTGMIARKDGQAASGKLGYGAPEQFVSQPIDPRSDVYSVGVMLWEALAGRRRRVSEDPRAIVEARIAGHEPRIGDVAPQVPAALAEICDRAIAHDRRTRYQSALEMRQALEWYLDGCGQPVDRWELSELMGRTFSAQRASMRRSIERHLKGARPERGRRGPQRRRWPPFTLLPVLARWWGRVRAVPILRSHGTRALVVVATVALVSVAVSTSSRSRAPRDPATSVVHHPPPPAPSLEQPLPVPLPAVTPPPRAETAAETETGPQRGPVARQARSMVRSKKSPPARFRAPPRKGRIGAEGDHRLRERFSRRPALDEEDPYAP